MAAIRRYQETKYWFHVPISLRTECSDFVDWFCEHEAEIDASDIAVCFELLCRMDELEGDCGARVCGRINGYASAWLISYYTRGGIFTK